MREEEDQKRGDLLSLLAREVIISFRKPTKLDLGIKREVCRETEKKEILPLSGRGNLLPSSGNSI